MSKHNKIDSEFIKKALGASEVIPLDGRSGMDLYLERQAKQRNKLSNRLRNTIKAIFSFFTKFMRFKRR